MSRDIVADEQISSELDDPVAGVYQKLTLCDRGTFYMLIVKSAAQTWKSRAKKQSLWKCNFEVGHYKAQLYKFVEMKVKNEKQRELLK